MSNSLALYRRFGLRPGLGAACVAWGPGADLCRYDDSPKEPQVAEVLARGRLRLRESLGNAAADRAALLELSREVLAGRPRNAAEVLTHCRNALRRRAGYVDDPPGLDTVQSLAATLRRGWGDCLSFTIALSALGTALLNDTGLWVIGGSDDDPSRHIWPVIRGLAADAADPMPPVGIEHRFARRREVAP